MMNKERNIQARVNFEPAWGTFDVYVTGENSLGEKIQLTSDMGMALLEEGELPEAAFRLDLRAAKVLMDDLWRWGVRPTGGAPEPVGGARDEALAAQAAQIEDLLGVVTVLLEMVKRAAGYSENGEGAKKLGRG